MYVDPPVSRQKTTAKTKPDGSKELSHTIEHDTTVGALRGARVKGRSNKRPMHASPFRSTSFIDTHPNQHHKATDTNLIDDRRQNADPSLERPAPILRHSAGFELSGPTDHPWTDAAGTAPRLRMARQDPRLERPAPLDTETQGFGLPADPFLNDYPIGSAGDVTPQPTQNIYTGQDYYYNPADEFNYPEDFNIGTGKTRRKNRRKRPQDQGTMGRADIFDAVTGAMRRSR